MLYDMAPRQVGSVLLLLLAACHSGFADDATMAERVEPVTGMTVGYDCTAPETLVVRYTRDQASLWIDGGWLDLPRLISASGERFSDGETVFWGKGREAWFVHPGLPDQTCTLAEIPAQWAEAEKRGVMVRAIGQEPGWILEIHDTGYTSFAYDYGVNQVTFEQVGVSSRSDALVYEARADEHRLVAHITPGPCLDSMSGEFMTHHVAIRFDGDRYKGCGRILK